MMSSVRGLPNGFSFITLRRSEKSIFSAARPPDCGAGQIFAVRDKLRAAVTEKKDGEIASREMKDKPFLI
jgi:hypothetical protein